MGLFDLFSAQPAQNAAAAQTAGLTQGYNQLAGLTNNAIGSLTGNYAQGLGALTGYGNNAVSALNQNYGNAAVPYTTNFNTGQAGLGAYGNAMGLNGAAGNAAAVAAFQNNPGYQFQLDTGNQNVMRNQAATGQLNSGATNVDLLNYGQGVANQGWNQYVSNLSPYFNLANSSAAGIAGVDTGLGSALANTYGGLGNSAANLYSGLGQGVAGLQSGQGQAAYGAQAGVGNANANAAMAPYNASANMWGAMLGGGMLGANLLGGKLGSNLFNTFGSQQGASNSTVSDIRVKEDVMPVGKLFDGLNVYQFRYKGEPKTHIGLMAQEVEQRDPDAVREFGGIKMVDYKRATKPSADYASALMRIAA